MRVRQKFYDVYIELINFFLPSLEDPGDSASFTRFSKMDYSSHPISKKYASNPNWK